MSALAVLPMTAGAQPVDSFRQLKGLIELGEDVTVVYGLGQVVEGRALDISSSTLTLMAADAPLSLDEVAVRRVSQRWHDPTQDGARIGFAVGAAPWWVLYFLLAQADEATHSMEGLAMLVMLSGSTGLAGMLVGTSMDAGRTELREIFRAPDQGRPRTSFGPLLSQEHLGAAVTIAW